MRGRGINIDDSKFLNERKNAETTHKTILMQYVSYCLAVCKNCTKIWLYVMTEFK